MNPTSAPVSRVYPQAACGTAQGQSSAQGSLLPLLRQITPGQSHTAPWREAHSRLGVLSMKEVTGMYCWPNRLSLSKCVMIPVVTQDKTSFTKIWHWRLLPSPLSSSFSKNHMHTHTSFLMLPQWYSQDKQAMQLPCQNSGNAFLQ